MLNNSQNNTHEKKNIARILLLAILMVPGILFADEHYYAGHHSRIDEHRHYPGHHSRIDEHRHYPRHHSRNIEFARVVRVDPIYRIVGVEPRHIHDNRQSRYTENRYPRTSLNAQPIVLGGIVGGLIGNQLGNDYNRGLTTITGAIIGSAIASATLPPRHSQHRYRRNEQLVGYRVYYRYHGKYHITQMKQHPGAKIALHSF